MTAMEVYRMLSIKDINIFKENMLYYTNLYYSDDEFFKNTISNIEATRIS